MDEGFVIEQTHGECDSKGATADTWEDEPNNEVFKYALRDITGSEYVGLIFNTCAYANHRHADGKADGTERTTAGVLARSKKTLPGTNWSSLWQMPSYAGNTLKCSHCLRIPQAFLRGQKIDRKLTSIHSSCMTSFRFRMSSPSSGLLPAHVQP